MTRLLLLAALLCAGCGKTPDPAHPIDPVTGVPQHTSVVQKVVAYTGNALEDDTILCESKPYSEQDLSTAALEVLYSKLAHFDSRTPSREELAEGVGRLEKLRPWVNSIQNAKIRAAYTTWLKFYSDQYEQVRINLDHPAIKTDEQNNVQAERERIARAEALEKCLPKPPSP